MFVRSAFRLIIKARYLKSVLNKYGAVLAPGNYHLFDNFRSASLSKQEVQSKAHTYFNLEKPSQLRTLIATFLNRIGYLSVGKQNTTGEYEAVYVANNYNKNREVKLFSFHQEKILTVCSCHEDMCKQLEEYAMLSHAYKMPVVVKNKRFQNALDVAMINQLKFPGDEQALTAIAKATALYNQKVDEIPHKSVQELIAFSYDNEQMNALLGQLVENIEPEMLQCQLPLCLQHGDLSKVNLLYGISLGHEDFWFIDWEHKKERVFFYDYFFYVLTSGLYGQMEPITYYLSGKNDVVLNEFFSHFMLRFCPDKRWDYLLVFSICYLKERVCDLGNIGTLEIYCNAINNFYKNAHISGETL